jgi:hypothetical protein
MRLASPRHSLPLLAFILPVAGCPGPDANATLADLPRLRIGLQTWTSSDDRPTSGFATISYDEPAFTAAHEGQCATLGGDLRGAIDGVELDVNSYGSNDEEFGGCYYAHLYFDVRFPADRPSVLTIADDSHTVRAEIAAGSLAPHFPTLRAPSTWEFRGGEPVRLGWSHPADLAENPLDEYDVGFHIGERGQPNANGDNFFPLPTTVTGDELRFTIPSPPPITGPGYITINMGYTVGSATTCEGAAECGFSASRSFDHTVEIVR